MRGRDPSSELLRLCAIRTLGAAVAQRALSVRLVTAPRSATRVAYRGAGGTGRSWSCAALRSSQHQVEVDSVRGDLGSTWPYWAMGLRSVVRGRSADRGNSLRVLSERPAVDDRVSLRSTRLRCPAGGGHPTQALPREVPRRQL